MLCRCSQYRYDSDICDAEMGHLQLDCANYEDLSAPASQAYVECMFSLCGLVNVVRCKRMRDVNTDV